MNIARSCRRRWRCMSLEGAHDNVMTAEGLDMARDQVLQLRATAEQRQLIDQAAAEGISRTEFILRR